MLCHHHMLKYRHSVHGQWVGPSGLLVDLRLPHDRQSTVATRLQGLLPRAIRQGPRLLPEGYGREFVMATDEPELPGKTEGAVLHSGGWTYALDDAGLPEGHMTPVYPLGLNVLLARASIT